MKRRRGAHRGYICTRPQIFPLHHCTHIYIRVPMPDPLLPVTLTTTTCNSRSTVTWCCLFKGIGDSKGLIHSVRKIKLLIWGNKLLLCTHQLSKSVPLIPGGLCSFQSVGPNWSRKIPMKEKLSVWDRALINRFTNVLVGVHLTCVLNIYRSQW